MKRRKIDLMELFVICTMTMELVIMAACLYFGIAIMNRMDERLVNIESAVAEIKFELETTEIIVEEPVVEKEEEVPLVTYFDVPLDEKLQDHIFAECEKYEIDPSIIIAMIGRESNYRANVVGDSGRSFGLMQIQYKWHSGRMEKLGCDDLLDPYQNVTVGIDLLGELLDRGKGIEWALMAYNGGASYADRLTKEGRVSDYVVSVMDAAGRVGTRN